MFEDELDFDGSDDSELMEDQDLDNETGNDDQDVDEDRGQSKRRGKAKPRSDSQVNLYELPQFKSWQAAKDREIAELRTQYKRDAEERERLLLGRMNEQEKREYQQNRLKSENDDLRRRLEEQEVTARKAQIVSELIAKTGAPLEVLDLSSEAAATRTAYEWKFGKLGSGKRRRAQDEDDEWEDDEEWEDEDDEEEEEPPRRRRTRSERPRPRNGDLGTGQRRQHSQDKDLRAQYRQALKTGNVFLAMQISDRAMQRGINLKPPQE